MTAKEQQLQNLQEQLEKIQQEIENLNKPETAYVLVTHSHKHNWYESGQVYKVFAQPKYEGEGISFFPLVSSEWIGVYVQDCYQITDEKSYCSFGNI